MTTPKERAIAILNAITLRPELALSVITGLCQEIDDLTADNRSLLDERLEDMLEPPPKPRITDIDIGELW